MEPEHDPHLKELLQKWTVPDAPPSLDTRVLSIPVTGWRFWLHGAVRVPVPAMLAMLALLAVLTTLLVRQPAQQQGSAPSEFNLADFQPVETVNVQIIGGDDVR
jgi:hypothetical protein